MSGITYCMRYITLKSHSKISMRRNKWRPKSSMQSQTTPNPPLLQETTLNKLTRKLASFRNQKVWKRSNLGKKEQLLNNHLRLITTITNKSNSINWQQQQQQADCISNQGKRWWRQGIIISAGVKNSKEVRRARSGKVSKSKRQRANCRNWYPISLWEIATTTTKTHHQLQR